MAKDILFAKSMEEAIYIDPSLQTSLILDDKLWDKIYPLIKLKENDLPFLYLTTKDVYGPEGDFEISYQKIHQLISEINLFINNIKDKDIIIFLEKFKKIANLAMKKNLNIYGLAD